MIKFKVLAGDERLIGKTITAMPTEHPEIFTTESGEDLVDCCYNVLNQSKPGQSVENCNMFISKDLGLMYIDEIKVIKV